MEAHTIIHSYYDQAHFIKDFKAVIGVTPAEYGRRVDTGI